jgi:hypothetical protein
MVAKDRIAMNINRVNKRDDLLKYFIDGNPHWLINHEPLHIISDANRFLKLLVSHSDSIFVIVSTAIK